jgi:acyl carrier protein
VLTAFETELRDKLIQRLDLADLDVATIDSETPLFEEGFGLDSIDALEIAVMVEEEYGIVIQTAERTRSTFGRLGDLARFIQANLRRDIPA